MLNEAAKGGISGSKLSPDEDELEVFAIIIVVARVGDCVEDKGHSDGEAKAMVAGENRLQGPEVRRGERERDRRASGFFLSFLF